MVSFCQFNYYNCIVLNDSKPIRTKTLSFTKFSQFSQSVIFDMRPVFNED